MNKLIKEKLIWLVLACSSPVFAVVCVFLTLLFASKLLYVPMGIFIALAVFFLYCIPLCFFAHSKRRWAHSCISLMCDGEHSLQTVADTLGVSLRFVEKTVNFSIKKGYIDGK